MLDIEEEVITCPSSMHKANEVAPSSTTLDQSTEIEVLPPPTWKHLHPKISKPSSLMTLQKTVYKIPYGAYKEVVTYDRHCWMVSKD